MEKSYVWVAVTTFYTVVVALALLVAVSYTVASLPFYVYIMFGVLQFASVFVVLDRRSQSRIYRIVKDVCKPIFKGDKALKEGVSQDIKHLKAEIKKYARSKNSEIEVLKTRDSFRREFIGDLSHEIKTPIFTVQGYVLTLLDGAINDKKVAKNYLERAAKGVERLTHILEDLDTISELELNKITLQYEVFDVIELIQNVLDFLEMNAQEKQITLTLDMDYPPVHVCADRARIQQVLINLVTNSIKYGKKQGTTEIIVDTKSIPNNVLLKVSDNGEGIESKYLQRIFERFFRIDKSRSREEGGSGLGLSIVKHIIEAHNKTIYVTSIFGVGSEFSFTLQNVSQEVIKQG